MAVLIARSRPPCPLCQSRRTHPRPGYQGISSENWSLLLCQACGTSFLQPMPDPDTLAKYYDDDYYGLGMGKFVSPLECIVKVGRYIRARMVRRHVPEGKILDVGCGRGLMLRYLKDWGYPVDGVELDTVAAVRASKNLGQKVFERLDDVVERFPNRYAAVCFWHSLEHLPEPGKALEMADELLVPGGLLVISAPHMESIQSRLAGPLWLHLDLPRHPVHFDMERLPVFMESRGYHLIRSTHFSQEYNVIDSLCYGYAKLRFSHLYPFDLIRNVKRHGACRHLKPLETAMGLLLLLPLTGAAFFVSNFFSMMGSGSTATLFLRKRE